ncbi:MAG: hypothetical protein GWP06_18670 [Actinobacteria bacterium]|nr:hypothetical protein [Actinomycetota bacterium]
MGEIAEIWQNLFPLLVGLLFLIFFVKTSIMLRKRGGSMTSVLFGATDAFYNREQRKAVIEVVEQKSDKKRKEQESGDDKNNEEDKPPSSKEITDKLYPENLKYQ